MVFDALTTRAHAVTFMATGWTNPSGEFVVVWVAGSSQQKGGQHEQSCQASSPRETKPPKNAEGEHTYDQLHDRRPVVSKRATVTLSDGSLARVQEAADALGIDLATYIRRALAIATEVDQYMVNGTLEVVDAKGPDNGGATRVRVLAPAM